jgi:hypothetical protein
MAFAFSAVLLGVGAVAALLAATEEVTSPSPQRSDAA